MILSHEELVNMVTGLQADIEARDIAIATLQNYFLVDGARRHRYFMDKVFEINLDDPILALQRDSFSLHLQTDLSDGCNFGVGAEHPREIKVASLEELFDVQRRSHAFYREQLRSAEQRYAALCSSFEEERKRLERDAAQGDDVVAMLEKEREKLQLELENERNQTKRLEKDLKKALNSYNNQKALSQRQRIVAAQLIREKWRLQKELSAKCERIEQLESKLGLKSSLSSDLPSSVKVLNASPTVKATSNVTPRSPVGAGEEGFQCKKSLSPPSACRESANAPPPPPSPLVPFCPSTSISTSSKLDSTPSSGVSASNRVNGCSPPSSTASFSDASSSEATKVKSPPPVKTRPEPPVRRTPEFNGPIAPSSRKIGLLEVDTAQVGAVVVAVAATETEGPVDEDEKQIASLSPPPPPPQMQLHYPYPGMQGNTHHPPVRTPRSTFGGGHFGASSSTSHFSGSRAPLRSPTSPPTAPASHQFPYAQPQRVASSGLRFTGTCGGGLRKTAPALPQQTRSGTGATSQGGLSRSTAVSAPRVVVAGRTATAAGQGNLYINGK
ncbi:CTTNBP2 N-terminal-like protein [Taenia crassiceps]|uniref:CTTNBP2 N-terminal-like protein n=1 Tax=Taenia crassiceps TaxID=6207 RepID=A0ABR4QT04_9CEST